MFCNTTVFLCFVQKSSKQIRIFGRERISLPQNQKNSSPKSLGNFHFCGDTFLPIPPRVAVFAGRNGLICQICLRHRNFFRAHGNGGSPTEKINIFRLFLLNSEADIGGKLLPLGLQVGFCVGHGLQQHLDGLLIDGHFLGVIGIHIGNGLVHTFQ